eukprot:358287-Chlamydomonas_euryale.AAC.18
MGRKTPVMCRLHAPSWAQAPHAQNALSKHDHPRLFLPSCPLLLACAWLQPGTGNYLSFGRVSRTKKTLA